MLPMFDWYDLNARHVSAAIWLGIFLAIVLIKSPHVRQSLRGLLGGGLDTTVAPAFGGLLIVAGVSTFCAVVLGDIVGYWVTAPVVTASVWTTTSGITILASYGKFMRREETFATTVRRVLLPPGIVAALVGSSTLSFWLELVLVPVVSVVGIIYVVARSDEKYQSGSNVCTGLLLLYATAMTGLLIRDSIEDIEALKMASHAVVLPVWATIWAVPYLRLLIAWERFRFVRSARSKTIRRRDYGEEWPLTVATAKLYCKKQAVWVEHKGKKYTLNGMAETLLSANGFETAELKDIWRESPEWERMRDALGDDENLTPWRVSIAGLIREGLSLEEGDESSPSCRT